jgi:hypothetical protein
MSTIIASFVYADILDITIEAAYPYEQGGRTITGNKVTIRTMGSEWGSPGVHTCMVPKVHMQNFWPLRNAVTGITEIPKAAIGVHGHLRPGHYSPDDALVPAPIPITKAQRNALRRAANGDIGSGTTRITLDALHNAGYLAPGTTVPTKSGLAYLAKTAQ